MAELAPVVPRPPRQAAAIARHELIGELRRRIARERLRHSSRMRVPMSVAEAHLVLQALEREHGVTLQDLAAAVVEDAA